MTFLNDLLPTRKPPVPVMEGTPVIRNSTNPDGGKELWKFMHSDPDTIGETFLQEPMRFLPTYESVLESDTYTNAEFFQVEDGYFLDLNQKIMEEHVPQLASTERPQTPATLYADSYPYASDMMNAVLAQDRSPEEAYQQGLEEAENRLQEGKDRSAW